MSLWKQGEHPTVQETIAGSMERFRRWGAEQKLLEPNVIEVDLPGIGWFRPAYSPLNFIRRATVTAIDYPLKVELTAEGQSNLLMPLAAALLTYDLTRSLTWGKYFIGPLVGMAIASLYWFRTWFNLQSALNQVRADVHASILKPGA